MTTATHPTQRPTETERRSLTAAALDRAAAKLRDAAHSVPEGILDTTAREHIDRAISEVECGLTALAQAAEARRVDDHARWRRDDELQRGEGMPL